jgi:hypothetical protein
LFFWPGDAYKCGIKHHEEYIKFGDLADEKVKARLFQRHSIHDGNEHNESVQPIDMHEFYKKIVKYHSSLWGIKGRCALTFLPYYNIYEDSLTDPMHVLHGVM